MTGTVGNEGSLRSEGCHRAVRVVERGVAGGGTLGSPYPDPIRMRRGAWSPSTSPAWSLDMPTLPPPPRHPRPPSVQGDKPDDCTLKVWCRAGLPMRRPLITWWGALSGEEVGWNRAGGGANEAQHQEASWSPRAGPNPGVTSPRLCHQSQLHRAIHH